MVCHGEVEWLTYRAGADVSDLAALHHVVERFHDFFSRRVSVQTVDLQDVDVRAQPLDARIYRVQDVLPRQSHLVHHLAVIGHHRGD